MGHPFVVHERRVLSVFWSWTREIEPVVVHESLPQEECGRFLSKVVVAARPSALVILSGAYKSAYNQLLLSPLRRTLVVIVLIGIGVQKCP